MHGSPSGFGPAASPDYSSARTPLDGPWLGGTDEPVIASVTALRLPGLSSLHPDEPTMAP